MRTVILIAALAGVSSAAMALPACEPPPAVRSDCVHDGDTWWFEGVKYRHAGIDTPEIDHTAGCVAEFEAGLNARARLVELTEGSFAVEPTGELDEHGRTLARIRLPDGREAGEVLLEEGLADKRGADLETDWCGSR